MVTFLKADASGKNKNPEDIDKLTLKTAILDNVLVQETVDLLAKYAEGDLKNILTGLDIYKSDLKTWSDLQQYVSEKSGGRITPQDLNDLASSILEVEDPAIAVIKDKILIYSESNEEGSLLREAVNGTDQAKIKSGGKWLNTFYKESISRGLTPEKLSGMFVIISTLPDTKAGQLLDDLISFAEEPLKSSLKSTDLKKEKIKSPEDLMLFLLTSADRLKYPEESVFKNVADLIASKDIPADTIKSHRPVSEGSRLWILWVIVGVSIVFFFILYKRTINKAKK
jgi:hypothetical protein